MRGSNLIAQLPLKAPASECAKYLEVSFNLVRVRRGGSQEQFGSAQLSKLSLLTGRRVIGFSVLVVCTFGAALTQLGSKLN